MTTHTTWGRPPFPTRRRTGDLARASAYGFSGSGPMTLCDTH